MRRNAYLLLVVCYFLLCPPASLSGPFTGIRGRAAVNGQTVEGVRVFVFESLDAVVRCRPVSRSGPTNLEGLYSLELPPGRYWVVGYGGEGECPSPAPGDLFCFYGGNPVVVEREKPTNVGLAMVSVMPAPPPGGGKGITGYVYDEQGEPLDGAVAYLYRNADGGLRGIPDYFTRTNEKGRFRARVGKGRYFVVVRRRQDGEMFGPTQVGDHFGYYPHNPVDYDGVSDRSIRVDAVMRLSQLEKFEGFEEISHGIRVNGVIRDGQGSPVAGYFVFAYGGEGSTGMPEAISGKSDGDGNFELTLFRGGNYRLVARKRPGGPSEGTPTGTTEIGVEEGEGLEGVTIVVGGNK